MKSVTLSELESDLDRSPEDWSIRLRLIEGYILEDDKECARRLVRDSPGDSPLPPELQLRLHTVMTQGASAVERYYADEFGGASPFQRDEVEPQSTADDDTESDRENESGNVKDTENTNSSSAAAEDDGVEDIEIESAKKKAIAETKSDLARPKVSAKGQKKRSSRAKRRKKAKGGAARGPKEKAPADPVKAEAKPPVEKKESPPGESSAGSPEDGIKMARPKPKPPTNPGGFAFVEDESDEEGGDLLLAAFEREPQAGLKVSAFTMALLVHIGLVVLGAFVVVNLPLAEPPLIVAVNVMAEREPVIAPRLVERDVPKAASASAPPASIVSSSAFSDFSVPEFDVDKAPDVTVLMTGVDAGQGMSFSGEGRESNVNFFGIRSGGKRIAFVVDATRYMLVDEKGGMFAYDKVKAEVGSMLAELSRGTAFNIILYEGKNLTLFREQPVAAKPSAVRLASEWLDYLNRDYENLGLRGRSGSSGQISEGVGIVEARDNLGYAKAIQLALEMDVNVVFAISSGYQQIRRSLSAEQMAEVRKMTQGGTPGSVPAADRARWNKAQQDTRDWLRKENEARASQGLAPKVVINFNALVRQVTGESPPRATGGSAGPATGSMPRPGPPYTPEEIEKHIEQVVVHFFKETNKAIPEVHMVLFLGEDEDIGDAKDHFRRLTRKNKGKLMILKGLAALTDVTSK